MLMSKIKSDLNDLVNKLKKEKFITVDTEHHDLHSYLGFIALIHKYFIKFLVIPYNIVVKL